MRGVRPIAAAACDLSVPQYIVTGGGRWELVEDVERAMRRITEDGNFVSEGENSSHFNATGTSRLRSNATGTSRLRSNATGTSRLREKCAQVEELEVFIVD